MRAFSTFLLIALAASLPAAAEDDDTTDKVRKNHWGLLAVASRWDGAGQLTLAPLDYTMQQSGQFESSGYGLSAFYRRKLSRPRNPALLVGCDFAGNLHDNERAAVWTNAATGEQSTVKLSLVWGYLAGSARFVWRENRMPEIVLGAGTGVYLIRIQEKIEDFGYADSGHSDSTWGGYLSAGLQFPIRRTELDVATEIKWHMFSFDDLGGAFPGQEATGPAYTVELGIDWNF